MSRDITPMPKPAKRAKKAKRGRARPDEPLATWCEVCGERQATQRHHRLPRSAGGTDEWDNLLDCCLPCHAHIHANPAASYEAGYLRRRGAPPPLVGEGGMVELLRHIGAEGYEEISDD